MILVININNGETPLHKVAELGSTRLCKLLVEKRLIVIFLLLLHQLKRIIFIISFNLFLLHGRCKHPTSLSHHGHFSQLPSHSNSQHTLIAKNLLSYSANQLLPLE